MQKIIQFQIRKENKFYCATSADLPIVTQAKTLDELAKNIEEAVELYLEDEDCYAEIAIKPSILVNYELPACG